jgi:hypothetical protein
MSPIPNQELLRRLHKDYYGNNESPQDASVISSFWKHYSDLFNVETDSRGDLISLSGVGFGTAKWTGLHHRVLEQLCILSHLTHLPNRRRIVQLLALARRACNRLGFDLTLDIFRQVCSLELLDRHIPDDMRNRRIRVLMIGDGYGVLSILFKTLFPDSTLALVDIGKTLLFQAYYCQKAFPGGVHIASDRVLNADEVDFVYCPAERLEELDQITFDLAVNVVSMQEMNTGTIRKYFHFLRTHMSRQNLFYCCNRESKTLIGGEVSEFRAYPWENGDCYLMDDACPWTTYFLRWGRAKNGPRVFGIPLPLASFYDGKVVHRLVCLKQHPTLHQETREEI